ncbi:MAG: Flp family type IVb pilin [Pseudomonadota bacterium]
MTVFKRFKNDDNGATAVEYTLLAGLIAVALAGSIGGVGSGLVDAWATGIMPLLIAAFT